MSFTDFVQPFSFADDDASLAWSALEIGRLWERFPTMTALGVTHASTRLRVGLADLQAPQGIRAYDGGASLARLGLWSEDHVWRMAEVDEILVGWSRDERFHPLRLAILSLFDGEGWLVDREAGSRRDLGPEPHLTHARDILAVLDRADLWARLEKAELDAHSTPAPRRPSKTPRV